MQNRDDDLSSLDALFAQARDDRPLPSAGLMERVLADALSHQPVPRPVVARPVSQQKTGWLDGLLALFGGAGALAGMGSAAVAGLMLGFIQPAGLSDMTASLWGSGIDSVSLMPSVDTLIAGDTP